MCGIICYIDAGMKYVVTGGAGFIGTNLVRRLLEDGHEVTVLDNYAAGKKPERFQLGAEYVEGDIRDVEVLDRVFCAIDGIFHLAALPRVTFSVEHPWETHDVNVNGTKRVLMAAARHGVKRVIFASSASTYGGSDGTLFRENTAVKKPISPYGLHKYIGEHYCRMFPSLYGLETVSLVFFNVYGPYFDPDGAYALVVGKFLQQIKNGEKLTICGDGKYYRDYTHAHDIVRANILAMQSAAVGKGEIFNIGYGSPRTVLELAELLHHPYVFVPERPGDPRFSGADNTKAKRVLGWEPRISLEEGIAQLKKEWGL